MSKYTRENIIRLIEENDVSFIRLQFVDIFGHLRNVAIPSSQLSYALDNKCMFDGSSIDSFARVEESDMYLHPDLDTFAIFPWRPQQGKVARFICDVYNTDGTPFEGDPRYILKKVLAEAKEMGYSFSAAPECEFFIFHTDDAGNPTTITHDKGGYFDLGPVDLGENVRRDICLTLEEMDFEVKASHHELAHAQHEIDLADGEGLKIADDIMTFKLVVKAIAMRSGLYASFMPKPFSEMSGSSIHLKMGLMRNGKNVFYSENSEDGLSDIAHSFIAGIINHAKSITAITSPTVNSYKRLMPGFDAPAFIAWSDRSKGLLLRIPSFKSEDIKIELRSPDPSCNPYLSLAVSIAAGLDGIKRNLKPRPMLKETNIHNMSSAELCEKGIERLPGSLIEAIKELENDSYIKNVLGEQICSKYINAKKGEWNLYSSTVSEWEITEYLHQF